MPEVPEVPEVPLPWIWIWIVGKRHDRNEAENARTPFPHLNQFKIRLLLSPVFLALKVVVSTWKSPHRLPFSIALFVCKSALPPSLRASLCRSKL